MSEEFDSFNYADQDSGVEAENSSLENENSQEANVEQIETTATTDATEQVETTNVDEATNVAETTNLAENTEQVAEVKTVDLRALQEARDKNRELRELISKKDQEIGKFQHLSSQHEQVETPVVKEINPDSILENLNDNDPISKAELTAYYKAVQDKAQADVDAKTSINHRDRVNLEIEEASKTMTEEKMGKGLSWNDVYNRLNSGEIKLSDGQLLDIQNVAIQGKPIAEMTYNMIIANNKELRDLKLNKLQNDSISDGKEISKSDVVSEKKEDLSQTQILGLGRKVGQTAKDFTDSFKF